MATEWWVIPAFSGVWFLMLILQQMFFHQVLRMERKLTADKERQWHREYLKLAGLVKAATAQEAAVADAIRAEARIDQDGLPQLHEPEPTAEDEDIDAADALQFRTRAQGDGYDG